MASGLEALRLTAMGAAGSPESLPLSPTVLAADCGCGGRDSKTKMHFNSLVCHALSIYCKKCIDLECFFALFYVSSQLTQ